jgi:hypothetical protein
MSGIQDSVEADDSQVYSSRHILYIVICLDLIPGIFAFIAQLSAAHKQENDQSQLKRVNKDLAEFGEQILMFDYHTELINTLVDPMTWSPQAAVMPTLI